MINRIYFCNFFYFYVFLLKLKKMKMWIDLDEKTISLVMKYTNAKDISEAINIALKEFIKLSKQQKLLEKK
jgi:Bacterial antitoxin of type II TA system, VapB